MGFVTYAGRSSLGLYSHLNRYRCRLALSFQSRLFRCHTDRSQPDNSHLRQLGHVPPHRCKPACGPALAGVWPAFVGTGEETPRRLSPALSCFCSSLTLVLEAANTAAVLLVYLGFPRSFQFSDRGPLAALSRQLPERGPAG